MANDKNFKIKNGLALDDNKKIELGDSADLQIYHDGATGHSIITESGGGALQLRGENLILEHPTTGNNYLLGVDGASGYVKLYHNGSDKLTTTSTGVDITGTLTSDGLTVDGGATFNLSSAQAVNIFRSPDYATLKIGEDANNNFELHESGNDFFIRETDTSVTKQRIKLSAGGDLSLYEDTGTTAKFFWDASAERLGIGTSSPSAPLTVQTSSTTNLDIKTTATNGTAQARFSNDARTYSLGIDNADSFFVYDATGASTRMVIDSSGRVGIGTSSPTNGKLVVRQSTDAQTGGINISNTGGGSFYLWQDGSGNTNLDAAGAGSQIFKTGSSERMRIDSSGNLLVGTTTTNTQSSSGGTNTGTWINSAGIVNVGSNSNAAAYLNRQSTDGDIAVFRKDGSTVGSIGVNTDRLFIGDSSYGGIAFPAGGSGVLPAGGAGALNDNTHDLGNSSARFKDLYLSGTVNAADIVFEGSTADDFETTVTVTDPTADRTFTIPNQTGTAMLWQQPWPDDPASNNIAIGDGALDAITSSDYHNTAVGQGALNAATSSYNTAFGRESAKRVTTGQYNTTMGHRSGGSDATSSTGMDYVVAIGGNAGASTYGDSNVIIGFTAAQFAGSAYNSVAIGYYAGYEMGAFSTVIGYQSGYNTSMNSSAQGTTALGYATAKNITSGDWNTCIGSYADVGAFGSGVANRNVAIGVSTVTGYDYNVSIGTSSTLGHSTAAAQGNINIGHNSGNGANSDYGVYIGRYSGYNNDANYSVFIGEYSGGPGNKTGNSNAGIGEKPLYNLTSGGYNSAYGAYAGYKCSSGVGNIYLGAYSGGTSTTGHATGSYCSVIGYGALPSSTSVSNEITLGSNSVTSLRCNVTTISSLSDERDKTDIEDLPYGLDFINDMRPVQFTWDRRDGSMNNVPDFGFIAQDLHDVELEHSSTNRTRLVKWENPDKLEADYVRSYPILVKAVQELSAKCDALEARLAALEGV